MSQWILPRRCPEGRYLLSGRLSCLGPFILEIPRNPPCVPFMQKRHRTGSRGLQSEGSERQNSLPPAGCGAGPATLSSPPSCFSDVSQSVIFLMNTYRVPRSVPGRGAAVGSADAPQTPRQAVPEERDGGSPGCQGQAEQNPRFTPGTREGGPSLHAFPNGRNSKLGCSA